MANTKISALTASTTPLAGTEVLPIVQSSATKQVSVANLTAGRSVAAKDLTLQSSSGTLATMTRTGISGLVIGADNAGPLLAPTTVDAIQVYNAAQSVQQFVLNTSNGNFVALTGNIVINTSGKGIDFSATPGTGTSELLADYEEGTWTPTITGSSSSGATYVSQSGKYTKIGRQVTVVFDVEASAVTATGSMRIGGLPFTIISGDPQATGSCMINNLNWSGGTMMTLFAAGGADYLQLYGSADDASFTQQQCVNESQRILGTLTYFV